MTDTQHCSAEKEFSTLEKIDARALYSDCSLAYLYVEGQLRSKTDGVEI